GDIRLYGESFIYRKPLMIDDNEGIIYALKLAGCPRSLAPTLAGEILFRCSRLCGLKRLPGVPGAFPILFLRPTSGFQEMKRSPEMSAFDTPATTAANLIYHKRLMMIEGRPVREVNQKKARFCQNFPLASAW